MRRRRPRRKIARGMVTLDYKQPETLTPFLNEFGRIKPRRITRLSAADQRKLAREVKRARHIALLPFVAD
ncbi:MAG: 30S ribosomal protein S18 [Chloroflexota bacterium]